MFAKWLNADVLSRFIDMDVFGPHVVYQIEVPFLQALLVYSVQQV